MELRHLRYFVAVAEELHFGRAAERLHVAQPAVSDQIRKLEQQLGVSLFRRTPRRVSLTDAGIVLLPDAQRLLRDAASARDAVRRSRGGAHDRLRLGYTPYGPPAMVPRALRRLRSVAGLEVQLCGAETRRLLDDVRGGELDCAVVHLPVADQGLQVVDLVRLDAVAAVAADGPPSERSIALADVSTAPLLLLRRSADPGFHDSIMRAFHEQGIPADVLDRGESTLDQLLLDVASGFGAAILPGTTSGRVLPDGITLMPLGAPAPAASVGFIIRDRPPQPTLARLLAELTAGVRRAQIAVRPPSIASTAPVM